MEFSKQEYCNGLPFPTPGDHESLIYFTQFPWQPPLLQCIGILIPRFILTKKKKKDDTFVQAKKPLILQILLLTTKQKCPVSPGMHGSFLIRRKLFVIKAVKSNIDLK